MKRNLDLIRHILIEIESGEFDWQNREHHYHITIMEQGGLLDKETAGITWKGQEFLSSVRSDYDWDKIKEFVQDRGLTMDSVPFSVISELALTPYRHWLKGEE